MTAAPAPQRSSRVDVPYGNERLTLFAREHFALTPSDLADATARFVFPGMAAAPSEPWYRTTLPSGLVAAIACPDAPLPNDDTRRLVCAMALVQPDGTVQAVGIVGTAVTQRVNDRKRFARNLLETAQSGFRPLDAPNASLRASDGSVRIPIPAGFASEVESGPDFDVLRLHKLLPVGQTASVGCYVGHAGHSFLDDTTPNTTTHTGVLGGASVQWREAIVPAAPESPQQWVREALLAHPHAPDLQIHVFLIATDRTTLEELQAIAEHMELSRQESHSPPQP